MCSSVLIIKFPSFLLHYLNIMKNSYHLISLLLQGDVLVKKIKFVALPSYA